jgi:3-deoxy-D-manno-octulosonic-acid transferase
MPPRLALSLLAYNLALPPVLLALLPGYLRKQRRRGGGGGSLRQRLGRYPAEALAQLRTPCDFWFHAVSVGEVGVAKKLVSALLAERPGLAIALTTTTTTGYQVAKESLPVGVAVFYSPVDLPWVVRRALRELRPRHLVLVEAEVWPNLVAMARRDGVAVSLVNARMSPRSERRFRRFAPLVAPVFALLDRVLVQEAADVGRWTSLGARAGAVEAVGSLKFDPAGASAPRAPAGFASMLDDLWGPAEGRLVALAASTHDGEEALAAAAYHALRQRHPGLRLAVAPRHFERAGEAAAAIRAAAPGASVWRRSSGTPGQRDDSAVLLVDSTGELGGWTSLADVAVIGKSFRGRGGQTPVEAIAAGVPVVFGPHMQNFLPLADQLVAAGGAVRAASGEGLEAALAQVLSSPGLRQQLAANARQVLAAHHGACRRAAARLLDAPS